MDKSNGFALIVAYLAFLLALLSLYVGIDDKTKGYAVFIRYWVVVGSSICSFMLFYNYFGG